MMTGKSRCSCKHEKGHTCKFKLKKKKCTWTFRVTCRVLYYVINFLKIKRKYKKY